jgi:hypothetical protein
MLIIHVYNCKCIGNRQLSLCYFSRPSARPEVATEQFVKDVYKGSVLGLINSLFDIGDLTEEDIESLRKRIKE